MRIDRITLSSGQTANPPGASDDRFGCKCEKCRFDPVVHASCDSHTAKELHMPSAFSLTNDQVYLSSFPVATLFHLVHRFHLDQFLEARQLWPL